MVTGNVTTNASDGDGAGAYVSGSTLVVATGARSVAIGPLAGVVVCLQPAAAQQWTSVAPRM